MRVSVFSFGVGLTSAASLALSLLFTRIFSVTMYYHFAFMIVSLAMLGIAVSGVVVYLLPGVFRDARKPWQAGLFAAVMMPAAMYALRVAVENPMSVSLEGDNVSRLLKLYVATAAPFLASGLAISLAIASAKQHIGRVYACDLLGAGLGCVLMVPTIAAVGAQAAVLIASAVAALGGALMACACERRTLASGVVLAAALVAALYGGFEAAATIHQPDRYAIAQGGKFLDESAVEFERWNAFSRITVSRGEHDFKWLHIDADAATRMYSGSIAEDGYQAPQRFSETRVSGLVYSLRPQGPALIIGPGGGSEVVSAIRAGVPRVLGVEVNPLIAQTVMQEQYADYNGHLYQKQAVEVHVDDGRSYVRRSSDSFSSIQATLVDTWAASAAGAFALSENNLYTADAFVDYLRHLNAQGVLSMTRWFISPPTEFLRLLGLGRAALTSLAVPVAEHAAHFFVAADGRMATMLLKRTPYTADETAILERECAQRRLRVLYNPLHTGGDARIAEFLRSEPAEYAARQSVDLSPSTDSRPFFFYTLRGKDFLGLLGTLSGLDRNNLGLVVLQAVLLVSVGLTLLLVIAPLAIFRRAALRTQRTKKLRLLCYFMMLGFGYILVELGLMQKFILFLGHPVYALAVVIAALLTSSGVGAMSSDRILRRFGAAAGIRKVALGLSALLVVYALGLSPLFNALLALPIGGRIAIAAALVALLGVFMGMLLPLGVRIASGVSDDLVPWAFGLNGATSVLGSSLAVVLSMNWGFTATLAAGVIAYLLSAIFLGVWSTAESAEGDRIAAAEAA